MIERAQRLLDDPCIVALGADWKVNHDVVPIAAAAREPRLAHEHALLLRTGDHQLALRTRQPQHVFSIDEGNGFQVLRHALAAGRARIEHQRGGAIRRAIPPAGVLWIDGLQLPVRWREWAAEDAYPRPAPRRAWRRSCIRVAHARGTPVSKGVAPIAIMKTVMPCVGRLRAEQEKQPDQNRCSHEFPHNVGIRLLSPGRCLLFRQSG